MTRSAAILVVDGFGVGAMPDAGTLRPGDVCADTLGSLAHWSIRERGRPLAVPNMAAAGLTLVRPDLADMLMGVPASSTMAGTSFPWSSTVRRAALGYPGADTFAGHQTMMGADMSHVTLCRVGDRLDVLTIALQAAGHRVEPFGGNQPLLVVDGTALVHDNLEADPALNWNVSARLDEMPWDRILDVATTVRAVAPVARVIAVGGRSDRPLVESVRPGPGGTLGLDTPASGFYRLGGLRVQHLGADIDHRRQLPQAAGNAGHPVTLIGKAADILVAEVADLATIPGVDTAAVLADTRDGIARDGLTVANVQQTDLAGHQQDPARYADLLEQVDAAVPTLVEALPEGGVLVITGDHGNDPTIGHAFHTREYTPVLAVSAVSGASAVHWCDFESLADIGASVAQHLGLPDGVLQTGVSRQLVEPAPGAAAVRRSR